MNYLLSKISISVLVGTLGIVSLSAPVLAVTDVLKTASTKSELAPKSLLLDITKAGDRLVAVGVRGHIIFSDDKGAEWKQANVPVSVLLTAVSFVGEKQGWAVGHSGVVLHTSDGGENWVKQFDGDQANKMIITQSEEKLSKVEAALKTATEDEREDLEINVEDASFELEDAEADSDVGASKPLLDVLFSSDKEGFVVGAYGFMFKTRDGGLTWENYGSRIDNPDRFHLNAITQIKGGALLIAGEAGVIFRSIDMGESWETVESPYDGSFFGLFGTMDKDVALAYGLRGHLFRSEDAGETWASVESSTESSLIAANGNERGEISIVGTSGTILFSKDSGRHFTKKIRENRLGNSSVLYVKTARIESEKVIIVGEEGVIQASPDGMNL